MDAFTLVAKLVLNRSEFDTALSGLKGNLGGEDNQNFFSNWGKNMGRLAASAITTAINGAFNFMRSAMETGMNFDAMMSSVKAVGQMTDEEFEQVRQKAIELGKSTKFTSEEVGQAMYYMALAGWDTEEMLSGIEGVLNLAAASGEDLGRSSDIVTDAITAMGMTAEDSAHFVNVLAAASANSNTTVGMMGEAFKYLATVGGTLEYSIEDVAGVLGLLANNGIKASQAGTTMRRILTNLIAPSDEAKDAMADLGISLFEAGTDARKPLRQVLEELREIKKNADFDLGGFTPEQVQEKMDEVDAWYDAEAAYIEGLGLDAEAHGAAFKELNFEYMARMKEATGMNEKFLKQLASIGGVRGISGLFAIMNSTDEDFEQLFGAIESADEGQGAAAEMATTMLDNLKGTLTLFNSAVDGLKILISDEYKGAFDDSVKWATEGIGKISDAFSEGGIAGALNSLTDWVVNGLANALSNDEVTQDEANRFGRALGDFVGHLVSTLITNAPEIISGLFEAGVNLAEGLIMGLGAGLFGTGAGTVTGFITGVSEEEQDAINQANETATKATGIVDYLDTLIGKYGDAAQDTEEWKTAMEELKKVFPEVNDFIDAQTGRLTLNNTELRNFIENSRQAAIESAKMQAVADLRQKYVDSAVAQGQAEINAEIAQSQANEAFERMTELAGVGKDTNLSMDQLITAAQANINERYGAGQMTKQEYDAATEEIKTLRRVYEEQTRAAEQYTEQANQLATDTEALATELEIAEKAVERMAQKADSFTVPGGFTPYGQWANDYYSKHPHASGLNYVPYDDYPALLHRGEAVLNASQGRQWRQGSAGIDFDQLAAAVSGAVAEAVSNISLNMDGKLVGSAVAGQVSREITRSLMGRRVPAL